MDYDKLIEWLKKASADGSWNTLAEKPKSRKSAACAGDMSIGMIRSRRITIALHAAPTRDFNRTYNNSRKI